MISFTQTSQTQLPNFPQVKYMTLIWNTCRNQGFFFSSPLLICSFLPSLLSQNAFLCSVPFSLCWQEQCPAGGSLSGLPGSSAASLPTLLQRLSSPEVSSSPCWMSVAAKTQKPPTQNHILNCQANSQWESTVKYYAPIWHFCSSVLNFWAFIDQLTREKE